MFDFYKAFVLCLIAAALSCCFAQNTKPTVSTGLCSEFRELRDLIPRHTLIYLITKHNKRDEQFRHSVKFAHTAEFAAAIKDIENSKVYKLMLTQLQKEGVDTKDIVSINSFLSCLLKKDNEAEKVQQNKSKVSMHKKHAAHKKVAVHKKVRVHEEPEEEPSSEELAASEELATVEEFASNEDDLAAPDADGDDDEYNDDNDDGNERYRRQAISRRSIQSFASDFKKEIPRKQLRQLITKNMEKDPPFANFYKTVRDSGFRRQILRGLASNELSKPLALLKENYIDVRKLISICLDILAMGPRV